MNLNRKGFTLIEILAVIVILSMLMAIMVPTVGTLLEKSKEGHYKSLENSIKKAAKIYMSDHRYDVSVIGYCSSNSGELSIGSIDGIGITDNKLPVKLFIDEGNVTTNADGEIINPKDDSQILDFDDSYVIVKYHCDKKDYSFELGELKWNENN